MAEKTREQHAALIQFLYEKAVDNDYHRRLSAGHPTRRGLERALGLANHLCLANQFDMVTDAELAGLLVGAQMHNGTPRTQGEINFIRDALIVAQNVHGPDYATEEDRKRVDYLFQVQANGKFFIPEPAPDTAKSSDAVMEPTRFSGVVGIQSKPVGAAGMRESWTVIYPDNGDDEIRLNVGQDYGLRRFERVTYTVIVGNSGQKYATAIRPFTAPEPLPDSTYAACGQGDGSARTEPEVGVYMVAGEKRYVVREHDITTLVQVQAGEPVFPVGARVRFNTRLVYGCERAFLLKAVGEQERLRGILIMSAGLLFVATDESNHKHWIAVAGGHAYDMTRPRVTYRLERNATGQVYAVDIAPLPQ